jgi:hypothetical protein
VYNFAKLIIYYVFFEYHHPRQSKLEFTTWILYRPIQSITDKTTDKTTDKMTTSMEQTMDSWHPITCKERFTAFDTDKFIIHVLYKGNPAYSEPINQRHTNLVFYDKALPYPEQDNDAHICMSWTRKAAETQTGIILDNPNPRCLGLTYMKTEDFIPCGGYYFIANYGESLYHKARLVAFFGNGKPVIDGWKAVFSHVIDDCFLVRVFVSDKRNPETDRADAKLCIFYLGDLEPFHKLGPRNGFAPEHSTMCTLVNSIPLEYTLNRYSHGSPIWKWSGHGETLICIENNKITTHVIDIFSDTGNVTSHTAASVCITPRSIPSMSDDGSTLFIQNEAISHRYDTYYDGLEASYCVCMAMNRTALAFKLPELTPCEKSFVGALNWIIDDIVEFGTTPDEFFHLKLHLADKRIVDVKTPFDAANGGIVHFTFKNAMPGRHYVCIGSCTNQSKYIYTVDTVAQAIYRYELSGSIGSHLLTKYDCHVFGDGTLFIGGFRNPRSYYHSASITYAVRPTMVVDALKTAPLPTELIQLAMSYLNV